MVFICAIVFITATTTFPILMFYARLNPIHFLCLLMVALDLILSLFRMYIYSVSTKDGRTNISRTLRCANDLRNIPEIFARARSILNIFKKYINYPINHSNHSCKKLNKTLCLFSLVSFSNTFSCFYTFAISRTSIAIRKRSCVALIITRTYFIYIIYLAAT